MDGVGIPIIERPRPLPGHDTPNPTQHTYTLKCEEPVCARPLGGFLRIHRREGKQMPCSMSVFLGWA